jgi:hypothetical protein
LGENEGTVRRPNLLGALVVKAAAFSVPGDPGKERHIIDFALLAAMAGRSDRIAQQLTARDRKYMAAMVAALAGSRRLWSSIDGAERGVQALIGLTAAPAGRAGTLEPDRAARPDIPSLEL